MPSKLEPVLSFAAKLPGVAFPIGRGTIEVDDSATYQATEGCEGDYLPVLRVDSIRRVFDILPTGAFLIVSEAIADG